MSWLIGSFREGTRGFADSPVAGSRMDPRSPHCELVALGSCDATRPPIVKPRNARSFASTPILRHAWGWTKRARYGLALRASAASLFAFSLGSRSVGTFDCRRQSPNIYETAGFPDQGETFPVAQGKALGSRRKIPELGCVGNCPAMNLVRAFWPASEAPPQPNRGEFPCISQLAGLWHFSRRVRS